MTVSLDSRPEEKALEAQQLDAFREINLLGIKTSVAEILRLIGRNGIFDEYTFHDISHVDGMLQSLDWLVPSGTAETITAADWLMTVLAVYFHDAGMLVTRNEFEGRGSTGFPQFRDEMLFGGEDGENYRDKIEQMEPDDRDRFLYQEFVRHHHAARVGAWIRGESRFDLGEAGEVQEELNGLLGRMDLKFREDLALVCESHHRDDLDNLDRYSVSQPYGRTNEETVNLQYAAILLRAADLLHITRDRASSIAFKIVDPTHPTSHREWAKQETVRSVRPKPARNAEGVVDERIQSDTVEVHALFDSPEGFFSLIAYLRYAERQLNQCFTWAELSRRTENVAQTFPWRRVDTSHIEAIGFLPQNYTFSIDQSRILDLLTGHTLYNDTRVVLRELVQNSIDAVRLQHHLDSKALNGEDSMGRVDVCWDSKEKVLEIADSGTGMTQETVEDHLLKVGASYYQDPTFLRDYPDFSAISQFGIGLLTAFMVADDVDVYTRHATDDQTLHLALQSVHGEYLMRTLATESAPRADLL